MMHRFVKIKGDQAARTEENGDLVIEMAFSSEAPVEHWWGVEVLSHTPEAVRMERLNDGASVLFNHNPDDLRGVHVPGSVRIDSDRVLRGEVRLTSATNSGREAIALVGSGVLSKASIGYRIHRVIEQATDKSGRAVERELDGALFERTIERSVQSHRGDVAAFRRALDAAAGPFERSADEPTVYRVIDWEPHENSLVTTPADPSVGIGRSMDTRTTHPAETAKPEKEVVMTEKNAEAGVTAEEKDVRVEITREERARPSQSAMDLEKARRRGIESLCKANKLDNSIRDMWIGQGISLDQVADDLLNILEERGRTNPEPASRIGLNAGEAKRFSLSKAILAARGNDWSEAGFELEASRTVAQRLGQVPNPHKFYVPFEVLQRNVPNAGQRDATVAGSAGYLVATENMGFIEMLRNRSVAFRMGARRLSGLQGNLTIPRQSAAGQHYWLANEGTAITESDQTFVQLPLSPKTVGAYTEISRQLLLQSSPSAEGIISDDLAQVVALAVDNASLAADGTGGAPTGILSTSGIGAVTPGLDPIDYSHILEFQTDVASSNVTPVAGGYVTTAPVAALLMQRARFSNTDTPLWRGNIWDGDVSGFRAMTSNQMPSATMIFGDWQELVIGEWGVLEVEVNPFANFAAGIIGVRAMYSVDVGVRRPFAFSAASSIV